MTKSKMNDNESSAPATDISREEASQTNKTSNSVIGGVVAILPYLLALGSGEVIHGTLASILLLSIGIGLLIWSQKIKVWSWLPWAFIIVAVTGSVFVWTGDKAPPAIEKEEKPIADTSLLYPTFHLEENHENERSQVIEYPEIREANERQIKGPPRLNAQTVAVGTEQTTVIISQPIISFDESVPGLKLLFSFQNTYHKPLLIEKVGITLLEFEKRKGFSKSFSLKKKAVWLIKTPETVDIGQEIFFPSPDPLVLDVNSPGKIELIALTGSSKAEDMYFDPRDVGNFALEIKLYSNPVHNVVFKPRNMVIITSN
jgi:hypothetical protein